jgi:hypothetical protein
MPYDILSVHYIGSIELEYSIKNLYLTGEESVKLIYKLNYRFLSININLAFFCLKP